MTGKISDTEKEKIRQESKKLLEEFSRKIDKIKGSFEDSFESSEARPEGKGWELLEDFKEGMFQNAPLVEDDLIIAEKGAWKE